MLEDLEDAICGHGSELEFVERSVCGSDVFRPSVCLSVCACVSFLVGLLLRGVR